MCMYNDDNIFNISGRGSGPPGYATDSSDWFYAYSYYKNLNFFSDRLFKNNKWMKHVKKTWVTLNITDHFKLLFVVDFKRNINERISNIK